MQRTPGNVVILQQSDNGGGLDFYSKQMHGILITLIKPKAEDKKF